MKDNGQWTPRRFFISYRTLPYPTLPYPTLPYLPYLALPCHILPYHTLHYLTDLTCHTLPYHIVPYPTLPYLTLSYHAIYHLTVPHLNLPYHILLYLTIPYLSCYRVWRSTARQGGAERAQWSPVSWWSGSSPQPSKPSRCCGDSGLGPWRPQSRRTWSASLSPCLETAEQEDMVSQFESLLRSGQRDRRTRRHGQLVWVPAQAWPKRPQSRKTTSQFNIQSLLNPHIAVNFPCCSQARAKMDSWLGVFLLCFFL